MCHFMKSKFCVLCFTVSCILHSMHGAPPVNLKDDNSSPATLSTPQYDSVSHKTTPKDSSYHYHIHSHEHELTGVDHDGIQLVVERPIREQEFYLKTLFDRYGADGVITFEQFNVLLKDIGLDESDHKAHKHNKDDHSIGHDGGHSDHGEHKHSYEVDHEGDHRNHTDHDNHKHSSHGDHNATDGHTDHHHSTTGNDTRHNATDGHTDHHNSATRNDTGHNARDGHTDHHHSTTRNDTGHNARDGHTDHHHSTTRNDTGYLESGTTQGHPIRKRSSQTSKRVKRSHVNHSLCIESRELPNIYHYSHVGITEEDFLHICPALIVQLNGKFCHGPHGSKDTQNTLLADIKPEVWGYSITAVIVISLVGLLGVAVIPIMQKVFYNHLLQFLVALAVGALSGDALLHLIPHAMQDSHVSHDHSDHESHDTDKHRNGVYKGLCGLVGIYFFFLAERLLTIITDIKRKSKKRKTRAKGDNPTNGGEKCMEALATHKDASCKEKMMVIHPGNKAFQSYAEDAHHQECVALNKFSQNGDNSNEEDEADTSIKDISDTDNVLKHSHHHHSHSHGQNIPNSVASIAWMVILGDGIHNFADGLAIGAAFANSITGGFSTSIAVFCHELPHEIGDFAVLLRAGMKPKQAIIYNCVSSILCFIGMLIGVTLGNIGQASLWIFVVIGGMFLYIALVDMLPEMTSVDTKQGEHPFCHLLFQISGMILGASIMLVIAIYEQDLMNVLEG